MPSCSNCGAELANAARFCPKCGTAQGGDPQGRVNPPRSKRWSNWKRIAVFGGGSLVVLMIVTAVIGAPESPSAPSASAPAPPPAVKALKPNSEYTFDEFKDDRSIEVAYDVLVNDSQSYRGEWLYFAGEATNTRDTTTKDLTGGLATESDRPDKVTQWALIRVFNQDEIFVAWNDDSDIRTAVQAGDTVEIIGSHQGLVDGLPQLALDSGKLRVLGK